MRLRCLAGFGLGLGTEGGSSRRGSGPSDAFDQTFFAPVGPGWARLDPQTGARSVGHGRRAPCSNGSNGRSLPRSPRLSLVAFLWRPLAPFGIPLAAGCRAAKPPLPPSIASNVRQAGVNYRSGRPRQDTGSSPLFSRAGVVSWLHHRLPDETRTRANRSAARSLLGLSFDFAAVDTILYS